MKNQPGTKKNHENQPGTMKNQPGTMNNHENQPGTMKNQPHRKHENVKNVKNLTNLRGPRLSLVNAIRSNDLIRTKEIASCK